MTLIAFCLVAASACSHAFWNLLSKKSNPSATFFLQTAITSSVVLSPLLIIFRRGLPQIPPMVWVLIAVTGAVQGLYYVALSRTYQAGDLSLGYPLARALPVVLVALVSLALNRGDQIRPWAYSGFAAVTAGCLLLPLPSFKEFHWRYYRAPWVPYALLAAVCITGYTLLDDQSLRLLRSLGTSDLSNLEWTLLFAVLEGFSISLFMGITIAFWRTERQILAHSNISDWLRSARVGLIIVATYGLVLLAMGYVTNVSYVSAFRQLSIPIGAALGILVRKESVYPPKLVGIGIVVIGLMLVALP